MPKVGYEPTEPIRSSANGCQVYAFPPQGLHSKSYQGRNYTCIARGVLFSLPGGIHQSAAGFLSASGISACSFRRPEIFNSGPPWIRTGASSTSLLPTDWLWRFPAQCLHAPYFRAIGILRWFEASPRVHKPKILLAASSQPLNWLRSHLF